MNDKIKWFGRYLGCKIAVQGEEAPMVNLGVDPEDDWFWVRTAECEDSQHSDDCILILKELEDISEEDLKECGFDWSDMDFAKKEFLKRFDVKTLSDKESLVDFIDEVDFLRSEGYAIGIPKEYYITEKELKQ